MFSGAIGSVLVKEFFRSADFDYLDTRREWEPSSHSIVFLPQLKNNLQNKQQHRVITRLVRSLLFALAYILQTPAKWI